jgi:hypothetical protein
MSTPPRLSHAAYARSGEFEGWSVSAWGPNVRKVRAAYSPRHSAGTVRRTGNG